jgi:hypothetical protein
MQAVTFGSPTATQPSYSPMSNPHEETTRSDNPSAPSYDEIALRAYFFALERHARGEPGDPFLDWLEAERQLNVNSAGENRPG